MRQDEKNYFPDVSLALEEPNGLLAMGGDLNPARLIAAYRHGIFPWYSEDQPILWWSPNPRAVLFPKSIHISRSLRKSIRRGIYRLTLDSAFRHVIEACAQPRRDGAGTWITHDIINAYCALHDMGLAHSVEAWRGDELVGGLYGVAIGRMFFGESMFSRADNASKVAIIGLAQQLDAWGYAVIDCQVASAHVTSLGAIDIDRTEFVALLNKWCVIAGQPAPWRFDTNLSKILERS